MLLHRQGVSGAVQEGQIGEGQVLAEGAAVELLCAVPAKGVSSLAEEGEEEAAVCVHCCHFVVVVVVEAVPSVRVCLPSQHYLCSSKPWQTKEIYAAQTQTTDGASPACWYSLARCCLFV